MVLACDDAEHERHQGLCKAHLCEGLEQKSLPIADCQLPIANCRLPIADYRFQLEVTPPTLPSSAPLSIANRQLAIGNASKLPQPPTYSISQMAARCEHRPTDKDHTAARAQ